MNIKKKDVTLKEFLSLPRKSVDRVMSNKKSIRIDFT